MRTVTFVIVLTACVAAQSPTLTVGSATARAGEIAYGALQVPAGADAATTISVAVVRGDRPGKTVAFISGAHGTEYASIVALTRLPEDRSARAFRHRHRPVAGLVTFIRGVPSMWQGATLANVSPILTAVPPYKKPS